MPLQAEEMKKAHPIKGGDGVGVAKLKPQKRIALRARNLKNIGKIRQ